MKFSVALGSLLLAIATLAPVRGVAQGYSDAEVADAISLALKKVDPPSQPGEPIVVVMKKGLPSLGPITVNGRKAQVLSWEQARDEQRAYFISIGPLKDEDDGFHVIYSTPATGFGGNVTLSRTQRGWRVIGSQPWHSSSGARSHFGEMYEGIACRNGTEMAIREYGPPGVCQAPEFGDVAAYREIMRYRR